MGRHIGMCTDSSDTGMVNITVRSSTDSMRDEVELFPGPNSGAGSRSRRRAGVFRAYYCCSRLRAG